MTAHAWKHQYLSPDNDFLAEKLCSFCTLHKTSSKGIHSLIAHKKYGVFRFPQIVLEVVFYSASLAHTACGNYYLRRVDKVYCSRLVTCDSDIKSAESDRIYALVHIGHCLFIETGIFVFIEYLRCLDSKWRIHIHRKIPMTRHHILRLDMPYKIQQFLCSAYCE